MKPDIYYFYMSLSEFKCASLYKEIRFITICTTPAILKQGTLI
jgi:hypothetical protein